MRLFKFCCILQKKFRKSREGKALTTYWPPTSHPTMMSVLSTNKISSIQCHILYLIDDELLSVADTVNFVGMFMIILF